jgi:predicted metalloendopeptidase
MRSAKAYTDKYFPAPAKAESRRWSMRSRRPSLAGLKRSTGWRPRPNGRSVEEGEVDRRRRGLPDTWRDYASIDVGNDAYANQKNAELVEYRHQIAKIGKPMDRRNGGCRRSW